MSKQNTRERTMIIKFDWMKVLVANGIGECDSEHGNYLGPSGPKERSEEESLLFSAYRLQYRFRNQHSDYRKAFAEFTAKLRERVFESFGPHGLIRNVLRLVRSCTRSGRAYGIFPSEEDLEEVKEHSFPDYDPEITFSLSHLGTLPFSGYMTEIERVKIGTRRGREDFVATWVERSQSGKSGAQRRVPLFREWRAWKNIVLPPTVAEQEEQKDMDPYSFSEYLPDLDIYLEEEELGDEVARQTGQTGQAGQAGLKTIPEVFLSVVGFILLRYIITGG